MKRQTLYFIAPRQVSLQSEDIPLLRPDQVLVQTSLSAISAGSEMLFYRGQFPRDIPVDASLPALKQQSAYPLKYGYCLVGQVIALGSAVENEWQNRLVFSFHPHESHFCASTCELIPIPDGVSAEDAVFLPNMETAVSLVMDGAPLIGERVAVFGQGVIGLLTVAVLSRFPLDKLITFDPYPTRRRASLEMGAFASLDPEDLDQGRSILSAEADLTYELSGSPDALNQAIALTGYGGRVVIGSWYGQKKANLELGGRFHRSRIHLLSSQVSTIAPELSARWDKGRRLGVAWEMLHQIQPSRLISQRLPFDQAERAYQMLDHHPEQCLQVILTYHTD